MAEAVVEERTLVVKRGRAARREKMMLEKLVRARYHRF
jgi:hypothetical protein